VLSWFCRSDPLSDVWPALILPDLNCAPVQSGHRIAARRSRVQLHNRQRRHSAWLTSFALLRGCRANDESSAVAGCSQLCFGPLLVSIANRQLPAWGLAEGLFSDTNSFGKLAETIQYMAAWRWRYTVAHKKRMQLFCCVPVEA